MGVRHRPRHDPTEGGPAVTPLQRMVAIQLAAALRDAMPAGSFDENRFLDAVRAAADEPDAA